jgi:hypothetical protein
MKSASGVTSLPLVCLLVVALNPLFVSSPCAALPAHAAPSADVALPNGGSAKHAAGQPDETSPTLLLALPGDEKATTGTVSPASPSPASVLRDSQRVSFRIAYLSPASESSSGQSWFQELKQALENDAAVRKAMADAGIASVALRPCDHPEDMLQRMLQSEFDLVFCPSMVYVYERIIQANRAESAKYHVLLRTFRSGMANGGPGDQIRQRGVLFVRKGCSMGELRGAPEPEELKKFLRGTPLAVSGSYDAAGYFYIRKMLWDQYGRCEPGAFLHCGSPQEVVKAVVSGLCDAGACEESVLRDVLDGVPDEVRSAGFSLSLGEGVFRDLVHVIGTTQPVPTDPVVIHERCGATDSGLGLAVRDALKRFYQERGKSSRTVPKLEPGTDAAYDSMEEDVKQTRTYGW